MRGLSEFVRGSPRAAPVAGIAVFAFLAATESVRDRLADLLLTSPVLAQGGGAMGNTIAPVNSPATAVKESPALFKAEAAPPSAAPVRSAGTADVKSSSETKEREGQLWEFEYFSRGRGKFLVTLTPTDNGMTAYVVLQTEPKKKSRKETGELETVPFPKKGTSEEEAREVVFATLNAAIQQQRDNVLDPGAVKLGWQWLKKVKGPK